MSTVVASERQFQDAVVQYARLNGWLAYHTHDSRHSEAGFPDLVLARPGSELIFAELKSEKGRVTPAQQEWLDLLRIAVESRVEVFIWRPSDWPEIERVLR